MFNPSFTLELKRTKVENMAMNWTVVHPIDDNSLFHEFNEDDMKAADVELYVTLRGFDDVFSNYVYQRTSYTFDEIIFNRKFVPMYRESDHPGLDDAQLEAIFHNGYVNVA